MKLALAAILPVVALSATRAAGPIHAALSAANSPYLKVWEGFQAELGEQASMSVAGRSPVPDSASVVVKFGSKAALEPYDGDASLIICMAPSVSARRRGRSAVPRVAMTPDPKMLLAGIKALQPGLSRLAVVWKSEFYGDPYLPLLREAGKAAGVEIQSIKIGGDADVPDQLRALYGRADALWMPPDPLSLNERNFVLFRNFSVSTGVPLYVPLPSLVERGATASIGVQFGVIGRTAARVAREAAEGTRPPAVTFPAPAETTLNRGAAEKIGLNIDAALKAGARVIP